MTQAVLEKRGNELKEIIADLQSRQSRLERKLTKRRVSREQFEQLQTTALKIGRGVVKADGNFKAQRKLIEILNVEAVLSVENGERKVRGFWELGPLTDYGQCEDGSGDFMPRVPHFTKRVTPKMGRPLLS
jgi:hypothetical protein